MTLSGIEKCLFITVTICFLLTACTDGIDGSGARLDDKKLKGTAAEGAPIKDAKITIKGSEGKRTNGSTNNKGQFSIGLSNLKSSYLLKIKRKDKKDFYSITSNVGIVNIHPFTDLITKNWFAVHGYSAEREFNNNRTSIKLPSNDGIGVIETNIKNILFLSEQSLYQKFRLFKTPFNADGTGFDYFLDFSDVNIRYNKINVSVIDPETLVKSKLIENVNLDTDFTAVDLEPPSKPGEFRVITSGTDTIVLAWNSSHDNLGVNGYKIYRDGVLIDRIPYTTYSNTGLISGKSYCFSVEAIDGSGNESLLTAQKCSIPVTAVDITAPTAITYLTAKAIGSTTIQLNWTSPVEPDVLTYQIFSKLINTDYSKIATTVTSNYQDIIPMSAGKICYTIFAVDAAKNKSPISNEFCTDSISDNIKPITTANTMGGTYTTAQSVRLICDDGLLDSGCATTYYTLDDTPPGTSSLVYSGPILINKTTTIRFISVDNAGNTELATKPENRITFTIESNVLGLVPGLEFSSASYQVLETAGAAVITVQRNGDATQAVTVDYSITDGTATANLDYSIVRGTLSWPEGYAASRTIIIPIKADNINDPNETLLLSLQNPSTNTILATNSNVELKIIDVPCNGILNNDISIDTTITEPCTVVTADIQVLNNASLTITPGATLIFDSGTGLNINNGSYLSANGSVFKPIVFTSIVSQAGYWKGIQFTNSDNINNVLNYVTVEYGGLAGINNANLSLLQQSSISISRSNFSHSSGYSIQISNNTKMNKFNFNNLFANDLNPIQLNVNQVSMLDETSRYSGNAIDTIYVTGNAILTDQSWNSLNIAYSLGDVTVGSPDVGVNLEIKQGTTIKFRANGKLFINESSAVIAHGSSNSPITFTADSTNPTPGDWLGIYSNGTILFVNVTIKYGGRSNSSGSANLNIGGLNPSVNILNSVSKLSAGYGLEINTQEMTRLNSTTLTNTAFSNNILQPISTTINNVGIINSSLILTGNSIDEIYISSGEVLTDLILPRAEVNYSIQNLNIAAALSIEPGVEISVRAGGTIDVTTGGSLNAIGTTELPIILRGESSPTKGYWQGIRFSQSNVALNKLQFVIVADAGSSNNNSLGFGNIVVGANSSVFIEDSIISDSASYGIYKSAFASSLFEARNTFINMTLSPDVYLQP